MKGSTLKGKDKLPMARKYIQDSDRVVSLKLIQSPFRLRLQVCYGDDQRMRDKEIETNRQENRQTEERALERLHNSFIRVRCDALRIRH